MLINNGQLDIGKYPVLLPAGFHVGAGSSSLLPGSTCPLFQIRGDGMPYVKAEIPTEVYHLTKRENVKSIQSEKRIRRFGDTECWFCRSPEDMLRYMEYTVLCKGKPYIATGGRIKFYPRFVPEDYVLLKLTPVKWEDKWYQWNQELPSNSSQAAKDQAEEFSRLKIGYRGDLRFSKLEVIELSQLMGEQTHNNTYNTYLIR